MSDYVVENNAKIKASRGVVALAIAGCLAFLPLAGCDSVQRDFGLNRNGQVGAASGAAFGGIVASIAGANPAWIAASVVLGGVTGGAIGQHLGMHDAEQHARTNSAALDRLAEGQTDSWHNEHTGNWGSTTVTRVTAAGDGVVCKSYMEKVHTNAETVTKEGTACRGPGGSWRIG